MAVSQTILVNQETLSFTGDKFKGDGFYGYADGLHTLSFHFSGFLGRVFVAKATVLQNVWFSEHFLLFMWKIRDSK